MHTLKTVFLKEVIDNFRDRRTLMSALLLGPIFGPVLFAFVINLSVRQSLSDASLPLDLPVIGAGHAPNLLRYLESNNIRIVEAPATRDEAVRAVLEGRHDVVVVIPETIASDLAGMQPARIEVITDEASRTAERESRRAIRALAAYSQEIAGLRLVARGVSPTVMQPFNIDLVDVSTPSGRSAMLLGMLSYFFMFALLSGGMNLAIDTTAGERERGSLEPLLCLPVTRDHLIIGKILAACLFMAMSLTLSLTAFSVVLRFLPLQQLGMTPNFGPMAVVTAFLLLIPFALLGAALMTMVASFTRSYKEAQTWLTIVILTPTLPILVVSILMLRPSTGLMFIPSLSQHLLLVELIRNEPLQMLDVAVSVSGTLALGVLVTWICARLYRREGLLG
ncbi:MAG: ABC transporter permease [Gammaproteobacteria bacterium]|nr:ABC transporter permease [Gammaproteobacteria bacterium]